MSARDDSVYLQHIVEAIDLIQEYVLGLDYAAFISRRMVQDAVIREIEIIGEATKNLSQGVRDDNPDVPWKQIAGMRDKLIHQYFGVDLDGVWECVVQDIPMLREQVDSILKR